MQNIFASADIKFAIEAFLCIFLLSLNFFRSRLLLRWEPGLSKFALTQLLLMATLFCAALVALVSPFDFRAHLIDFPVVLNVLTIVQPLFWLPLGLIFYENFQIVFVSGSFKIPRVVFLGLYVAFAVGILLMHQLGNTLSQSFLLINLIAFLFVVLLPLLLASFSAILGWAETVEAKKKQFDMRLCVGVFSFVVIAFGDDLLLPYIMKGQVPYTELWRGTILLLAVFSYAYFLLLNQKITYYWQSRMFFMLSRSVNDCVLVYNKSGKLLFANPSACNALHLPIGSMRKENVRELLGVNDDEILFQEHSPVSAEFYFGGVRESYSTIVLNDMGTFDTRCFVLIFSKNFDSLQATFVKTTLLQEQLLQQSVLQKMQEEIKRKETLLMAFLNNLPMQVSVKNDAGVVILQNRLDEEANGKLLGMTESQISEAEKQAKAGERGTFEKVTYSDDKVTVREALNYVFLPVSDGSGENMVLKICRDITDSVNLNRERMRMLENEKRHAHLKELSTLTGGIAHEFNNILGAQLGFLTLVKTMIPEDSPARKYLEQVEIAGEREKQLIEKLLVNTRSEMHGEESEQNEFYLAGAVLNALVPLNKSMPQNITVENSVIQADLQLLGSEVKLLQVLSNLFNNAVYAMRSTGGVLSVSAEVLHLTEPFDDGAPWTIPAGDFVCIRVSDTGEGIPSNVLDRLFSPLFTTKPPGEGLGLGLYTCMSLVRAARGEMTVQTTLGKGSTFKVYWPLAKNEGVNNG